MQKFELSDFVFDKEMKKVNKAQEELLQAALENGIKMRHKAKQLEEQGKGMKADANIGLDWVFVELGISKAKLEGFGSLSRVKKERTSYDPDKIGDVLLRSGVDAKIIKRAIKAGAKKSLQEYIEFRRAKKK